MQSFLKASVGKLKKVKNKVATICAVALIDEAKSWQEIIRMKDKTSYETYRSFEKE